MKSAPKAAKEVAAATMRSTDSAALSWGMNTKAPTKRNKNPSD